MKVVSTEEFRKLVDQYLASAAREEIVLTENDHPPILLQGLSDSEGNKSDSWESSPDFWDMIRQRRREQSLCWQEAKRQLALE
jgi:hypothetical protein